MYDGQVLDRLNINTNDPSQGEEPQTEDIYDAQELANQYANRLRDVASAETLRPLCFEIDAPMLGSESSTRGWSSSHASDAVTPILERPVQSRPTMSDLVNVAEHRQMALAANQEEDLEQDKPATSAQTTSSTPSVSHGLEDSPFKAARRPSRFGATTMTMHGPSFRRFKPKRADTTPSSSQMEEEEGGKPTLGRRATGLLKHGQISRARSMSNLYSAPLAGSTVSLSSTFRRPFRVAEEGMVERGLATSRSATQLGSAAATEEPAALIESPEAGSLDLPWPKSGEEDAGGDYVNRWEYIAGLGNTVYKLV